MGLKEKWDENLADFDRPITPEIKRKYFGNSLIEEFERQFETKSWNIPHYATISFHTLFGALPNIRDMQIRVGNNFEDLRVHMFLIMESGAGKGGGFAFTHKVAKELNLNFEPTGDLTNSAIVGSMQPPREGEKKGKLIAGYLHPDFDEGNPVDIFASSEASQVIDTDTRYYDKNAMTNLQKAMNIYGTVDNLIQKKTGVSDVVIRFCTHASLYMTSYKPEKIFTTLTRTGLLQRMIMIYVPVSLTDKKRVGEKHLDMVEDDNAVEDIKLTNILEAMNIINEDYTNINRLGITKDAKQTLRENVVPYLYRPLESVETGIMDEVKKFTTRYQTILYKLCWHHAITRLSDMVETQDVAYAKRVLIPIYNSLIAFMENEYTPQKTTRYRTSNEKRIITSTYKQMAKRTNKKLPWIFKKMLVKEMEETGNISLQASRQRLLKHITIFHESTDKRGRAIVKLKRGYI